jgi:8-oxo-dGTP pyrophosphatase MutT (NUDIX family)
VPEDRIDERLEELNRGAPTVPRPAAGVILMRRGGKHSSNAIEVLLGKRTSRARFMAGVWVFPGGAVDGAEDDDVAHRATALRELEEEAGVTLAGPEQLVPFSRWITPEQVKIRYDTRFYLAQAGPHTAPKPDGEEIVETGWFAPSDALARHREGGLELVFPTIKMLETLARFGSPEEALEQVSAIAVEPILPRVDTSGPEPRILLPGDPGYARAAESPGS